MRAGLGGTRCLCASVMRQVAATMGVPRAAHTLMMDREGHSTTSATRICGPI